MCMLTRMEGQIEVIGQRVIIRYSDGHTVFLDVGPDSVVLRMHLGAGEEEDGEQR